MKCRKARKLVFDFIDGLVSDKDRLDLETHLSQCPECDKLASQLARSMDLLHRAPQEKPSENFAWKVRLRLNQERNSVRERSVSYGALFRAWNIRYSAAAVAAFAAVLTVGLLTVNQLRDSLTKPDTNTTAPYLIAKERQEEGVGKDRVVTPPAEPTEKKAEPAPPKTDLAVDRMAGRPPVSSGSPWYSRNVGYGGAPSAGPVLIGVIDRPAPMSAAELDSIVSAETKGLSTAEEVQLLNQYILLLQRRMLEAYVKNGPNR